MVLDVVLAVSGVGVDGLDPQQGVVREGVQGGGGGRRKRGGSGGEHGVVVLIKVHGSFWETTETQHFSFTASEEQTQQRLMN